MIFWAVMQCKVITCFSFLDKFTWIEKKMISQSCLTSLFCFEDIWKSICRKFSVHPAADLLINIWLDTATVKETYPPHWLRIEQSDKILYAKHDWLSHVISQLLLKRAVMFSQLTGHSSSSLRLYTVPDTLIRWLYPHTTASTMNKFENAICTFVST